MKIPVHYKVLGEMAELSGFVIPLLSTILIFTAVGVIPFLFFKKTRQWKTPIYILLIISGWQYGGILAGNFYLNFLEMKISNSMIFAFGILFLYLSVFVSVPIIVLQWLKNNKWKHLFWLLPLVFLYMGLKINAQMNPILDFNSTLKPNSLIHLEGGLRDRVSKDVAAPLKDNPDIKGIILDSKSIEDVILSPAVSFADADRIFKENSKAVVVVTAYDEKGNAIRRGSGFIVRRDGAVVTNYHVIGMARDIKVKAGDKVLDVEGLIFTDEKNDLVILKAKARDMPVVKLGVVEKANIGEHVYVISSPEGLDNIISDGLLSGIRKIDEKKEILQMTAPTSHGSSGSPVFNRDGEVIGVATFSTSSGIRNLSFAMPVKLIKDKISSKMVTTIKESGLEDYINTAMYWFYLGGIYGESGRYEEAIVAYKQAIRIDPVYAEAHNNLGQAYGESGRYEEAIMSFKKVIKINLDFPMVRYNLGSTYGELGRYGEAIEALKQAIGINPDYADAHYNLGYVYVFF